MANNFDEIQLQQDAYAGTVRDGVRLARKADDIRRAASLGLLSEQDLQTLDEFANGEQASIALALRDLGAQLIQSRRELNLQQEQCANNFADLETVLSSVLSEKEYLLYSASADMKDFIFLSPLARHWMGMDQPDLMRNPSAWLSMIHPDDVAKVDAAILAASHGQAAELEYRISLPDGEERWHCNHFHPVRDQRSGNWYINGIISDVTLIKQRENLMRDFAFRQEVIFTLTPDCFVTFDNQGQLNYANPAFEHLFGLMIGDLEGISIHALQEQVSRKLSRNSPAFLLTQWVEQLQQLRDDEFDFSPKQFPNLPVLELQGPPNRYIQITLFNAGSDTTATVLQLRDISQQHEVERIKSEFLSTAAHELRTPMASIMGFAELLRLREFPPEAVSDMLDTILRQSRRLTGLLNELLDLARIEARRGKDFHMIELDLGLLICDTVKILNINDYSARVAPFELPPLLIRGDMAKLQQALLNVLSNALKYSPQGGQIKIHADLSRLGWVGLAIADQGIGMTAEQLSRVFERFFRADDSGSIPGTGLGMSLVKEIIELHGGEVKVASEWGQGTTVTVWLRLKEMDNDSNSKTE